jgi:glycosyltransferase involved in cell wall biosynthesis/GT2 family glycosyltransferase
MSAKTPKIAVLMTCHNRKASTLTCLARLIGAVQNAELTIFLLDDGSTDGTSEAVQAQFPSVRLLSGSGDLFWCGGMRRVFAEALKDDFDFYLWLNDDTFLESDALQRLMSTYQSISAAGSDRAIVVGSTRDPRSGQHTYGGVVRSSRVHPMKYRLLEPGDQPLPCDTMCGNCVLIPRSVSALVQNLSPEFRHGIGDFEYGVRARKMGCTVWIAPGYVGTCAWNKVAGGFLDPHLPLMSRWKHMMSSKGLPPSEHLAYMRNHGGPVWPLFWVMPYVRVLFEALSGSKLHGNGDRNASVSSVQSQETGTKVAFVTNFCTHYTRGLFEQLACRFDVDYYFYSSGDEWYWEGKLGTVRSGAFYSRYLAGFALGNTRVVPTLPFHLLTKHYDLYVKCINGKFALPITYLVARLKRRPFVLRTEIWADLETPLQKLVAPLVRYIYRHADSVIAYGEHVKQYLVSKNVQLSRIFLVRPVVDNSKYNQPFSEQEKAALRSDLEIAPSKKVVLYLGRLATSKGCKYLVEAFNLLRPDDAILVMAGDGPERANLEALARQYDLMDRVRFVGHVAERQTPRYYAIAYVQVLPSITTKSGKEPWALVVNEAFNQGVPVIASDAVGAAAGGLVRDGENGFVIPEQDPKLLAHALQRILDDEPMRQRMSARASSDIEAWTYERMTGVFAEAIRYAMKVNPVTAPDAEKCPDS